jgi:FeS assembly protein SufD
MNLSLDQVNIMPAPTWRWLGINSVPLKGSVPDFLPYSGEPLSALPEGVLISNGPFLGAEPETGMGGEAADFVKENSTYGLSLHVGPGVKVKKPISLNFLLDEKNPALADDIEVIADEGSEVTIVMSYHSAEELKGFHGGLTKLHAAKGAVIHLVQVQLLGSQCVHFDNIGAAAGKGASIDIIQAELGAGKVFSGIKTRLDGTGSNLDINTIYFGDGSRSIDMNYLAEHAGCKTKSEIHVGGALLDRSGKTFRGTINFLKGAKRSVGHESEFNLLFSPKVRCRTAPLILCSEEDVDGQHAAATGRIDAQRLFYLMSRGLSEMDAKKLLIEAQFRPVTDRIPDESLRAAVTDYVKVRLTKFEPVG